jgi:type 1 glutamine amidotransferase
MSKLFLASALLVGILSSAWAAPVKDKPRVNETKGKTYEVDERVVTQFDRVAGDLKPLAVPKKPRKVLIYAVSHGPHQFVIPTAKVIFARLGQATGAFTAVVSDELANFEPGVLKQYDAVCFVNTTGEVFNRPVDRQSFAELTEDEKKRQIAHADRLVKNLTQYVRDGGGFVGIHAATDTLKQSPAYGEMLGGYFDGHPWSAGQTVRVRIEKPEHPLCRDIFDRDGFSITDEIYQMKAPYARDQVTVLMSVVVEASEQPAKPLTREDKDYPLSWIKAYGKGRVFYSALGHNTATFGNPLVLRHWLAGLQYVMGDFSVNMD